MRALWPAGVGKVKAALQVVRALGVAFTFSLGLMVGMPPAQAAAPYVVQSNGTVINTSNGLVWDQCSRGLTGSGCTGTVNTYTFSEAQTEAAARNSAGHKGYTDWRVPSRDELWSLVLGTAGPTIDTTAFPGTLAIYWTSDTYGQIPTYARVVDFGDGTSNIYIKTNHYPVRLVRSGQTFASSGTPPVLSAVALSDSMATGTTLSATSSAAGTGYWLVVPSGSTAPTARQVVDGATYGSVSTVYGGSAPMTAAAATAFSISDQPSATAYDTYFVAVDTSLHASAVSGPMAFGHNAVQSNGTVLDTSNGLVWDQCSRGLTGSGCTGTVNTYTFSEAQTEAAARNSAGHKGYTDWRVPSRDELWSLVLGTAGPTIDTTAFPGTLAIYWTSDTYGQIPTYARVVDFGDGTSNIYIKTNHYPVRLVRSGQTFASSGTPPVLSEVALSDSMATGTTLSATSSAAGTGYWLVVPSGSTAPTARQVVDGATYPGASTVFGGSAPMTATTAKAFNITGLTTGTAYQAYFVAVDGALHVSALSGPLAFTPKTVQTLSFGTAPSMSFGGANGTVTATSASPSSNNPVSYSVPTTPSVCSVNSTSGSVTALSAGTCTVAADLAGDTTYSAAAQITQDISIAKASQTLSFTSAAPSAALVGAVVYTPVAASNVSGLTPVITVDAASAAVCTLSGGAVSFQAAGTCKLLADQAGNANYSAAAQVTQSFSVSKGSQTLTFTSAAPSAAVVGGATYTPVAASNVSGLTPVITVDAASAAVCTLSGEAVSFQAAGTCKLLADQAGNANYSAAAQVTQSFSVSKGSQTLTFTSAAPSAALVGGATYTPVAASNVSGLTPVITVDAASAAVCTLSGGAVSFQAAGTCKLLADQAGNANYSAAAQVTQSFSVSKGSQTLTFTSAAPSAAVVGGATYTPVAASNVSGLTPVITVDAASAAVCTLSGGAVSFQAAGTCKLLADQAGNANYSAAAQVTQSFSVSKGSQTLTFTSAAPSAAVVGGATYTPVAASNVSGLTPVITVDAASAAVCTLSGGAVSFQAAGTCKLLADQAGNANYSAAAQVTQSFSVSKGSQTLTFTSAAPSAAVVGAAVYTPVAASNVSGLTPVITVDAASAAVCTLSGGAVSFQAAGTCKLLADQAGNANYNAAAQVSQSFNVGKGTPAPLTAVARPASIVFNGTSTLSTSGGSGTGAVTYSVVMGGSNCNITGSTLSGTGVGLCTVSANQSADANYNAGSSAPITVTVTVAPMRTYSAPSPTGGGQIGVTLSGTSSAVCGFASTSYRALPTGASASPPGFSLPHGVFAFSTNDQCGAASGAVTFTLTYPSTVPANARLYKFGPTASDPSAHWYTLEFTGAGSNTISFIITDGGLGDDDLSANGTVVDDVGVGVPVVGLSVQKVHALSEWALLLLLGLMGLLGMARLQEQTRLGVVRLIKPRSFGPRVWTKPPLDNCIRRWVRALAWRRKWRMGLARMCCRCANSRP